MALRRVKLRGRALDTQTMDQGPPTPRGFLGRIAAALAALTRYAGCSLRHNPLPEIREVGHEWRLGA